MFEDLVISEMMRDAPPAEVVGFNNFLELPKDVPCIIIYSHKAHDQSQLGNETRQITKLLNHADPGRKVHHIVRPAHSVGALVKQTISPLHALVLTELELENPIVRSRVNKRALVALASKVAAEKRSAITIAPDAGCTPLDHADMIDAQRIHTQGVLFLRKNIEALTCLRIPIIPVSLNHLTRKVSIGEPILDEIEQLPKATIQQILAARINELDSRN